MLSKISQTQRLQDLWYHLYEVLDLEKLLLGVQIRTMVGPGRVSAVITGKEHEGPSWMMMMVYILIGAWVAQIYAVVKTH